MAIIYAIAFYMGRGKSYWATVSAVAVNLLTLHRGLSEAAADFARIASKFDWPRWQETRF